MLIFCTACGQTEWDRVRAAGVQRGQIEAQRQLPDLPDDCRVEGRSGVVQGDRLDVAVLKVDQALHQQNARTRRCAAWYDDLQAGVAAQGAPT